MVEVKPDFGCGRERPTAADGRWRVGRRASSRDAAGGRRPILRRRRNSVRAPCNSVTDGLIVSERGAIPADDSVCQVAVAPYLYRAGKGSSRKAFGQIYPRVYDCAI